MNLDQIRDQIDSADKALIEVIKKRLELVKQVGIIKKEIGAPVYVPERELALLNKRRAECEALGINPDLIEDLLRRLMRESYGSESAGFKCVNPNARKIVIIGGRGGMGKIFVNFFQNSGYVVESMGSKDWDKADDILKDASLVIVSVPIDKTELVIRKLSSLPSDCILADFTSTKTMPLNVMLEVHKGPVVGLHPMFGPDISNLAKQLIIWVEGRNNVDCQWLREQMLLWGANIVESTAKQHDEAMGYIQALRHFTTFCYGIYLAKDNPDLQQIMQLSSPIYHMELMMVGRLFAQDASLYADIILSNNNNLEIIERYINVLQDSLNKIKAGDRNSFIKSFNVAKEYFGEFSTMFMKESKGLLAKMHDAKMIKNK